MQTGKGRDTETITGLNWTLFHCSSEQLHNRTEDVVYSFIVSGTKKLLLISTYKLQPQAGSHEYWMALPMSSWLDGGKEVGSVDHDPVGNGDIVIGLYWVRRSL